MTTVEKSVRIVRYEVIKKDIVYSGDVLNTTARIQGLCNQYKVDFLLSKIAYDLIEENDHFEYISLGNIELRGKENEINLITISH